jgi:predicted Fe-Mo cluster-binding NifX family protein
MDSDTSKIAFVVEEDRERISAHFGRSDAYLVVTIDHGKEISRQIRPKFVAHGDHQEHEHHQHGHGAGHHGQMVDPILDCQILVARGMGQGALNHLSQAGIEARLTDHKTVQSALEAYLAGRLDHQPNRLHAHAGQEIHLQEE